MGSDEALSGHVAVVAGATRGLGRAIAVELGARGATVYGTGRTTRAQRSPLGRPETIEETAELVDAAGGQGIAVPCDHTDAHAVADLFARVADEQGGRLDVLVNDIWGFEADTQWDVPFWDADLDTTLAMQRTAVHTHIITSRFGVPLMVARGRGLVVEVTDGDGAYYRGNLAYDLAKQSLVRLAFAQHRELEGTGVVALAVTPGFLRSEQMLEHFGVTEATWREAVATDPHFAESETPRFCARGVAALAADPEVARFGGRTMPSWELAKIYDIDDVDGRRPDWGSYFAEHVLGTEVR